MGHQEKVINAITTALSDIGSPFAKREGKFLGVLLTNLERGATFARLGTPDQNGDIMRHDMLEPWISQVSTDLSTSFVIDFLEETADLDWDKIHSS